MQRSEQERSRPRGILVEEVGSQYASMPMNARQLKSQVEEMRDRVAFLRSLLPDNPSYKLWLGDVVELVNLQWGLQSREMKLLRSAVARGGRQPMAESPEEQRSAYIGRLDDLEAVLESYLRNIGEPVTFFD